jgi:hypothetical protein
MPLLLLLTVGSALAYFAMSGSSDTTTTDALPAASVATNVATNWPPTSDQTAALQAQVLALVLAVDGKAALSATQSQNLSTLLANAPAQYAAALPVGYTPNFADYAAWMLGASASGAVATWTNPDNLSSSQGQAYGNGMQPGSPAGQATSGAPLIHTGYSHARTGAPIASDPYGNPYLV